MIIQRPSRAQDYVAPSDVVLLVAKALNAGDVDGALARFSDDAQYTLIGVSPDGPQTFTGQEQLRIWFHDRAAEHQRVEVGTLQIERDLVIAELRIWCDCTRQLGVAPSIATAEYLVRDGKIQRAIRTIHPESAAKLHAALRHMEEYRATGRGRGAMDVRESVKT